MRFRDSSDTSGFALVDSPYRLFVNGVDVGTAIEKVGNIPTGPDEGERIYHRTARSAVSSGEQLPVGVNDEVINRFVVE